MGYRKRKRNKLLFLFYTSFLTSFVISTSSTPGIHAFFHNTRCPKYQISICCPSLISLKLPALPFGKRYYRYCKEGEKKTDTKVPVGVVYSVCAIWSFNRIQCREHSEKLYFGISFMHECSG